LITADKTVYGMRARVQFMRFVAPDICRTACRFCPSARINNDGPTDNNRLSAARRSNALLQRTRVNIVRRTPPKPARYRLSGDRDLSSRAFPVFVSDENYVFATVTRS
jgi:hypothetical protein